MCSAAYVSPEPPRRPTLRRWRRHAGNTYSIYRGLEYELAEGTELSGHSLDLGGGRRAGYHHLLRVEGRLDGVNIDVAMEPSVVADLNEGLPFRSASVDNIITFNTLEHVYDDGNAVREIMRVLRPGGSFHIGVPFLYRVHASPSDYHRHTAAAWQRMLEDAGAAPGVRIEPILWDRLTSAFSFVEFTRLRRLLKPLVMLAGVVLSARARGKERVPAHVAKVELDYALGYFLQGRRAS